MASDYDFLPASNGSGDPALMHINAPRLVGATTISVDTVVNVPAKFIATSGSLLPSGLINPADATNFKGHLSGGSLVIDAFEPGSTDTGNTASQVVVIKPTTGWGNRVAQFIKNATGLGTPEAMTASTLVVSTGTTLPAGDIGTADVADSAITPAKLFAGTGTTWPWQSFTPTLTHFTVGNGTMVCKYQQTGKTVKVRGKIVAGSTSSSSAGAFQLSLPVTAHSDYGSVTLFPAGGLTYFNTTISTYFPGVTSMVNTTTAELDLVVATSNYGILGGLDFTNGSPNALHTGDYIEFQFEYEAA